MASIDEVEKKYTDQLNAIAFNNIIKKDEECKIIYEEINSFLNEFDKIADKVEKELERQTTLLDTAEEVEKKLEKVVLALKKKKKEMKKETPKRSYQLKPPQKTPNIRPSYESDEDDSPLDHHDIKHKDDIKMAPTVLFVTKMRELTSEEFKGIPKYMVGRISLQKLNEIIVSLNKVCTSKYDLMSTPMSKRSYVIENKIRAYLRQNTPETKDNNFIVEEDITHYSSIKIDKAFFKFIVILRHCNRLSEVRANKLTRYVFV